MDGKRLIIRKLLLADQEQFASADSPGHEHAIVDQGYIDFFNLKVLAFLMCRGQYSYKTKALYKLLWDRKDALETKT